MVKNKKEKPENEEPKKKKRKKKKKKEIKKTEDFQGTMRDIKEYISEASKPYAKYINKLEDNYEGSLFVDFNEKKVPKNKSIAGRSINIPLSLFSEIIVELAIDLIPEDEREDIFVALDNLFLQIDLIKKSIVLVNNHGM